MEKEKRKDSRFEKKQGEAEKTERCIAVVCMINKICAGENTSRGTSEELHGFSCISLIAMSMVLVIKFLYVNFLILFFIYFFYFIIIFFFFCLNILVYKLGV